MSNIVIFHLVVGLQVSLSLAFVLQNWSSIRHCIYTAAAAAVLYDSCQSVVVVDCMTSGVNITRTRDYTVVFYE